mgnify:CR=1 FL=1
MQSGGGVVAVVATVYPDGHSRLLNLGDGVLNINITDVVGGVGLPIYEGLEEENGLAMVIVGGLDKFFNSFDIRVLMYILTPRTIFVQRSSHLGKTFVYEQISTEDGLEGLQMARKAIEVVDVVRGDDLSLPTHESDVGT